MKIFFTDNCPICHKALKLEHTDGYRLYECKKHYFYSEDVVNMRPEYAKVTIPGFLLTYDRADTGIAKFDGPEQTSYKWVCAIPGHLKLYWDNLQYTSDRLKTLLVFS